MRLVIVTVALGLAGLAAAAYEQHKKNAARPESLLDPRAAAYANGALIGVVAVFMGGKDIISRSEVMAISGLKRNPAISALSFMREHGLVFSGRLTTAEGKTEDHFMATEQLLTAVSANPEAYREYISQAKVYYPEFEPTAVS